MSEHRRAFLLASLLSLLLAAQAGSAVEPRIPLHGRILGSGGDPLPGARALLVPVVSYHEQGRLLLEGRANPEPVATATAGTDGDFHLAAPEPGMWKVLFEAKGFVPAELILEPLLVETDLPAVRLERDAGLRVRVTGPDGQPLAGARVRIEDARPRFFGQQASQVPMRIVLADETGTAVLPRGSGETVNVRAGAPGYPPVEAKQVRGNAEAVRLLPGKTREIEVRDVAGKPVPGVIVRLGQGAWAVGRTSEAGLVSVAYTDGGERHLILTTEDGRWLEAFVLPPGPKDKGPQKLRLAAPEMLPGKVVSSVDGRPLAGALVWTSMDPGDVGKTGPSGEFRLPAPAGQPVTVSAARVGFFRRQAEVMGRPGHPRRPSTLILEPALAASGLVVDESGRKVAGVEIESEPQRGGRPRSPVQIGGFAWGGGMARTDGMGRFRFSNLAVGVGYTLRLTRKGFAPLSAEIPPLEPGRPAPELRFVMRQGRTAFGRVLGMAEAPVAGARVTLRPRAANELSVFMGRMRSPYEATTGEGGRFEIADLPAGSFDLEVRGEGYAPLTVPGLAVPEGKGRTDLGTVMLAPGATLEGSVVDPKGLPIAGAEVRTYGAGDFDLMPGEAAAVSGADGFFRIEELRPGEALDILVSREGYVPGNIPGVRVPAEQPLRVTLQPASAILGNVLDPGGRPIPNASVSASSATAMGPARLRLRAFQRSNRATTDEQGAFRLDGVAPGPVTLTAVAQGFQRGESLSLDLPVGRDLKGVEIVLQPGATIEGRVFSPSGKPVAGANVSAFQSSGTARRSPEVMSDGDGWYVMQGVPPGPQSVAALHPDYRRAVRDLDVKMGENTLDLTFESEDGSTVSGRVADDAGVPVAGARVNLHGTGLLWNRYGGISGRDGAFEIDGVLEGDYLLIADKEGFARSEESPVKVSAAPVSGLEVRLSRGGSIHGKITGLDFAELARVFIVISKASRPGQVMPDGSYRIEHLGPGEWTVTAGVAGTSRHAEGTVTLEPGASEAQLDLEFGGGLTLSGQVLRNGVPVGGQPLTLKKGETQRWAQTDREGRFRFEGLDTGSYELDLSRFGSELRHRETVEMTDDREVQIDLRTVRVSGRVLDGGDSSPIGGAQVTLIPASGSEDSQLPLMARTDSRGTFRFLDVTEGDWKVRAVAEGYGPGEVSLAVAGTPVDDLDLTLQGSEGVTFEALLPSGRPPDQVWLAVLDPSGKVVTSGRFPAGENGRFRVSTVPAGTWEVLLDSPGAAPTSVSMTAPGNAGRVILPPAGGLLIRVSGLAGSGTAATVALNGPGGRPFRALEWGEEPKTSFELDGGTRRFERLPAGVWDVRVSAADGRTWTGKATVTPGATAEVVLE